MLLLTDAQETQNKIRRVVRRRGRQRANRQLFGNRVVTAPIASPFAAAPIAAPFAAAPIAAPFAAAPIAARPALRFAPAPAPTPFQVFEITPNNVNFGEYAPQQLIQVRQPFAAAPIAPAVRIAPTPAAATTEPEAKAAPAPVAAPVSFPVTAPVLAPIPAVR